jgi:hypothetical protein
MGPMLAFAVAGVIALGATLATVLLLRPHLQRLLDELCGTPARAGFWMAVSLLAIGICGVLAGTSTYGYPDASTPSTQDVFLGGITQLRLLLVGLLGSVLLVAWGLVQAIRGFERRADRRAYYAAMERGAPPPAPPPPGAAPQA